MELQDLSKHGFNTAECAANTDSSMRRDDVDLMRLGKKPVLKRTFGFMPLLGFSCTVVITWEAILLVSSGSLLNGGPAGLIWGYLIGWVGIFSTFTVLAEIVSLAPTAAGQYHWVAILAPASSRRFLSYVTGWVTIIGWQAVVTSASYLIGTLFQSLITILRPDYVPHLWHSILFSWAVLLFAVFINTVASKSLAYFEGLLLVLHILGFLAILIPLVYLAPHGDATIFNTLLNLGEWPTQGLSFMVGLPSVAFALVGSDSAIHMAEEVKNAPTVVPRAILLSILINGLLGFAMVLAYVFCLGDLEATLGSTATVGHPFLYVFLTGTQSTGGAVAMGFIVTVLAVSSMVGVTATSSRMMWSFARDRGMPGWRHLVKLDRRTSIPLRTIAVTTVISIVPLFIALGSVTALNNVVNLTVASLYSSYFMSCSVLLWRRMQPDGIKPYSSDVTRIRPDQVPWGPFRVPGAFGIINNIFACCYLLLIWFWAFWPPVSAVTPQTMNYSCLTFGVSVLFAIIWYCVRGKHSYKGPIVEVDL